MKITLAGRSVWINFHHLFCFFSTAEAGSLRAASHSLGISPSALSIQIKKLESDLGFPLFQRKTRKLTLNAEGQLVYEYAHAIFRLGTDMVGALLDRPSRTRQHLKIGTLDSTPKHLVTLLVRDVLRKGECTFSIQQGRPDHLLDLVTQFKLDLVITNERPREAPGTLVARKIREFPLVVSGHPKFKSVRRMFPKFPVGQRFILPTPENPVRHEFEQFCLREGLSVEIFSEAQDVMVQKLLAIQGYGLCVTPDYAVREYLRDGKLIRLGELPGLTEQLYIVSAQRRIPHPTVDVLVNRWSEKSFLQT